jgi:hypothetical protein
MLGAAAHRKHDNLREMQPDALYLAIFLYPCWNGESIEWPRGYLELVMHSLQSGKQGSVFL